MSSRAAYEELAKARMRDIYATMDEYRSRAADPSRTVGMSAEKALAALEHRCDRARDHLRQLCDADDDGWESMRSDFDSMLNELQTFTQTALARVK